MRASEADAANLKPFDLVIVGSPTQGGRPLKSIQDFLDRIPAGGLSNTTVAAFDTRTKVGRLVRFIVNMLGYASGRIAKVLKAQGGILPSAPEGFLVTGKEGPVIPGELERATAWAKGIIGSGRVTLK